MASSEGTLVTPRRAPARRNLIYDPAVRGASSFQLSLAVFLVLFFWWITNNAITNLRNANIASGFGFLENRAGFEVLFSLIPYSSDSSYGRAFIVGLLNTIYVAIVGIFLATILGFLIGIARLSKNLILRWVATVYVEFFRNIPLLLQLLFWYKAVLSVLPSPRQSVSVPGVAFLSNRGLVDHQAVSSSRAPAWSRWPSPIGIVASIALARWATARRTRTGQPTPILKYVVGLIVGLPIIAGLVVGARFGVDVPELAGFNFRGGLTVTPEFLALILGLTIYTAAFIAEIVRAGILAVSHGQTEAASSLGLDSWKTLRLVVVPQALRVIIPPLTNQFLNLTKNSSLAVAIGYPDLVSVFAGTVLNQTGQAVEVITMTMGVYLALSLVTSAFMNWFNSHIALKER